MSKPKPPENPDPDSCSTCLYWREETQTSDTERWGTCRRYPPVPVPSQTPEGEDTIDCLVSWVILPMWCGEHKPRTH